jgi:hypothetical protein
MVSMRLEQGVDRLAWTVGALGVLAGLLVAASSTAARVRPIETVEASNGPGRDAELVAVVSEPMTRVDAMPFGDYMSVIGDAPWGEATVLTAESGSCGEVVLYAKVGATWWSLHLADSGRGCALPSAGESDVWSEVVTSGPTFIMNASFLPNYTLEVALDTQFHSGTRTTTWHTTAMCDVDGTGVPTCTHALVK